MGEYRYKVSLRHKGYRMSYGKTPIEAVARVLPGCALVPVQSVQYADVCAELVGGVRQSRTYFKLGVRETQPPHAQKRFVLSYFFPEGYSYYQYEKFTTLMERHYGSRRTDGSDTSPRPNVIMALFVQLEAVSFLHDLFVYNGLEEGWIKYHLASDSDLSYYEKYLVRYTNYGGRKEEFDRFLKIQIGHFKRCTVYGGVAMIVEGSAFNGVTEPDEKYRSDRFEELLREVRPLTKVEKGA